MVPIGRTFRKKNLSQGDCKDSRGCGTPPPTPAHPPACIRFDIKPKNPPAYHGKATEDVEVWSQQVDNYLQLLGGDDDMQVAYVGTLLQGAAQLWFQRENNAGRCGKFCCLLGCRVYWVGIGTDAAPAGQRPGPILSPWDGLQLRLPVSWDSGEDSYCNHRLDATSVTVIRLAAVLE